MAHSLLPTWPVHGWRHREKRKRTDQSLDPGENTWGLEHGSNELGVGEPQDGVEGPKPKEVDIRVVVAQFSHQLHAFLIALDLGMEKAKVSLDGGLR